MFHVVLVSVGVLALFVRVSLLALLFVGAGLGLAYLTWWFWTTARPESPALAALELMSEREYMQLPDEEKDAFEVADVATCAVESAVLVELLGVGREHLR